MVERHSRRKCWVILLPQVSNYKRNVTVHKDVIQSPIQKMAMIGRDASRYHCG